MDDDSNKTGGQSPQDAQSLETTNSGGSSNTPGASVSPDVASPQGSLESTDGIALTPEEQARQTQQQRQAQQSGKIRLRALWHAMNAYLLGFIFLVICGFIIAVTGCLESSQNHSTYNF